MNVLPQISQNVFFAHGIAECIQKYNKLKPLNRATLSVVGGTDVTITRQKFDEDTGETTSVELLKITLQEVKDAKGVFKDLTDLFTTFINEAQLL